MYLAKYVSSASCNIFDVGDFIFGTCMHKHLSSVVIKDVGGVRYGRHVCFRLQTRQLDCYQRS